MNYIRTVPKVLSEAIQRCALHGELYQMLDSWESSIVHTRNSLACIIERKLLPNSGDVYGRIARDTLGKAWSIPGLKSNYYNIWRFRWCLSYAQSFFCDCTLISMVSENTHHAYPPSPQFQTWTFRFPPQAIQLLPSSQPAYHPPNTTNTVIPTFLHITNTSP